MGIKNVHFAFSGNSAFRLLDSYYGSDFQVGFILSDINMEDGTGLEFLAKVRADHRFKKIPFLILSSENDRNKVMEALKGGATNYLLKPWTLEQLDERVNFCWNKMQATP